MAHPKIDQQITFLYTANLGETRRFYEKTLGLPLALDQGACLIFQVTTDSYVGFCQQEGASDDHPDVIFTMVTTDVDRWYDHLSTQGVHFEKPPAINPQYQIYHCFLRDPNGYLIEIQNFLDPRWVK